MNSFHDIFLQIRPEKTQGQTRLEIEKFPSGNPQSHNMYQSPVEIRYHNHFRSR